VPAGATVPVSSIVALIGEPGEATGNGKPSPAQEQTTQPAPGRNEPASMPPPPPAQEAVASGPATPAPRAPAPAAGRVRASPLARRIATERGIDLAAIPGSGPEGRIVLRDLEGAAPAPAPPAAAGTAARPTPVPPRPPVPAAEGAAFTDVPLTQLRKTIAKRLAQSLGPVPTFYLTTEVDMERAWDAREALKALGEGPKVSFNDIIIKAVATALRQHPACNASWQDDRIRYWHDVHVSMAVAIEDGLITPVIRHTDRKSLREIATEAQDLAARARDRRLQPEEYTGGTFSVSNLGMLDIDEFTAIINPPEAGILAVGRIAQQAVAHEGQLAVRRRLRLTMSCDHRVIDGATGAQFLRTLKTMLENPLALVW